MFLSYDMRCFLPKALIALNNWMSKVKDMSEMFAGALTYNQPLIIGMYPILQTCLYVARKF